MITHELLDLPGIRHGFFTREGGVSEGSFASLNCGFGSGDDTQRVRENRARVVERLGVAPDHLVTCYQIHSAETVEVKTPWPREAAPRADGLVTTEPGIALGMLAADCAPVLLADAKARIIGACHAGWRGALTGIITQNVDRLHHASRGCESRQRQRHLHRPDRRRQPQIDDPLRLGRLRESHDENRRVNTGEPQLFAFVDAHDAEP